MTDELTAHQALYGYDDGHRLLVASTQLSADDRRWLLRQTDSADAGTAEGWSELLAGYPLPSGAYAWAMTWPAPEMPRPGCVWTHVVIISAEDIGADAAVPLGVFSRPSGPEPDVTRYRRPLILSSRRAYHQPVNGTASALALAALLWAFYEQPSLPTRVGRVHLADAVRHALLVSPWQLAWPELRATVSVTDAPVTPRRLPDRAFDLQLQSTARGRSTEDERVVDGVPPLQPPRWVDALVAEAKRPGGLSTFLRSFGPLMKCERSSMVPLVQCWRALAYADQDPEAAAVELVGAVLRAIPAASRPKDLTRQLLDPVRAAAGTQRPLDELALLRALIGTAEAAGLDDAAIDVSTRAARVVRERPTEVGSLLDAVGSRPSGLGSAVVESVADALDGALLKSWLKADAAGVAKLLRLRPMLASHPDVWRALGPEDAWDALRRIRGKNQRVDVVAAMVTSGLALDPGRVAASWKGAGPAVVDRLITDGVTDERLFPWLEALTLAQKRELARRKGQDPAVVDAVVAALEPNQLAEWSVPFLLAVAERTEEPVVLAKLYLAGLKNTSKPTWATLAVATYERLHHLAVNDNAAGLGHARGLLADVAIDTRSECDVGWRLAKATNRALKRSRWDPRAALACSNQRAFTALIDSDDHAGLARRILDRVLSEPTPIEEWQGALLFAVTRQKADRDALAGLAERFEAFFFGVWKAMRPW